ncbi:C-type mannose receptor 2-like [Patiria miniata]|uniref:C-type lectin domain-containing protein n=1 Tax=Patiria miniata TaxID=46514 RepID=A0A914BLL3_PATMI|nr:C-type mannose receptor 2-like [Patiria miniata]
MAFVWRECFRWAPLVFLLIVTPGALAQDSDADQMPGFLEIGPATIAPASTISCEDIHGDSFGNQTAKPGVCYLVADVKGDFHDARAYCQALNDSLGWDVADIEDVVENMLIQDALTTLKENGSLSSATTFWVGQNDLETENTWAYLNDSSNACNRSVYLNWRYEQPNGGRRQNCIAYFYNENGNFQDRKCDDDYYYLCKVKVTSDTVPSCPDFVEDISTEASDACLDIWPVAFSNPAVPGVCYAHESYQQFYFEDALNFCKSLPGGSWSVVDIEDAEENLFLEAWNRDNFPKNNGYWIGQNDREQEADWRYTSSGQCPVYLNWRNDQPNGGREQNCMVMFKTDDGAFQDKACNERRYYSLCKLKKDPGPTPNPEFINCNGSTLPSEVAECTSLKSGAFGSVDNPGYCYYMSGNQMTWEQAVQSCQALGWELIDIENALENEILAARFRDFWPTKRYYWVGQNDRATEGVWQYSSNSTPVAFAGVYLNWEDGQPNDVDHTQNCIMMDKTGQWEDKSCTSYYYVTCKKRVGQIPTTTAAWTDPCPKYQESAFGDEANPGVCYILTNEKNTWEEAQKVCDGFGSGWQVPDIEDDADLLALVTMNSRSFRSNDGYWIGLNDAATEGTWVYLDTSIPGPAYERWDSSGNNQPDGGVSENCAVFQESRDGKFKDVPCGSESFFVACKNRNAYDVSSTVTTHEPTTDATTTQSQTTEGATTQSQTTMGATTQSQTTEGLTTPPSIGTTQLPTTVATTRQQTTESATTGQPIDTTEQPTTKVTTRQQTTEGATTEQPSDTTEQPTTEATTPQQTTEGATTEQPTDSSPITGSGRFVFKSADATCSSATALHTSSARDRFHCARKCLIQGNCRSFSFAASGEEDACELCSEVLDADNLQRKIGSVYYFESK